jgi:hypothetical protein
MTPRRGEPLQNQNLSHPGQKSYTGPLALPCFMTQQNIHIHWGAGDVVLVMVPAGQSHTLPDNQHGRSRAGLGVCVCFSKWDAWVFVFVVGGGVLIPAIQSHT